MSTANLNSIQCSQLILHAIRYYTFPFQIAVTVTSTQDIAIRIKSKVISCSCLIQWNIDMKIHRYS